MTPCLPRRRSLTRHGKDRKAELLHHAEQLFAERGYEDTRMIDIAEAAGVAKGLVYWYFENKETLFREIVVDMGQRLRRAQGKAIAGIDDPLERLYVGTAESVRFIAEQPPAVRHHLQPAPGRPAPAETRSQSSGAQADDAAALLAEGQERGWCAPTTTRRSWPTPTRGSSTTSCCSTPTARRRRPPPGSTSRGRAHGAARYVVRAVGRTRGHRRGAGPAPPGRPQLTEASGVEVS